MFCRISREVLRDQPPWIKQAGVPSPPLAEHLFGLVVIGGLLSPVPIRLSRIGGLFMHPISSASSSI